MARARHQSAYRLAPQTAVPTLLPDEGSLFLWRSIGAADVASLVAPAVGRDDVTVVSAAIPAGYQVFGCALDRHGISHVKPGVGHDFLDGAVPHGLAAVVAKVVLNLGGTHPLLGMRQCKLLVREDIQGD